MPFVANRDETRFYAYQLEELHRHNKEFSCPICDDQFSVVLPINSGVQPHFRHLNNEAHGEPESAEHLDMKDYIRKTAQNHGFKAEWEIKISDDFSHVADVVIYFNDLEKSMFNSNGIAVECQCSGITVETYDERNDTYLNKGFTPWWIFGGKYSERIDPDSNFEEQHITKIQRRNNMQVNGWSYHYKNRKLRISNFIGRTKTKGHYRDITTTDFLSAIKVISGHLYEPYLLKYNLTQTKRVGSFYKNGTDWISLSELIKYLEDNAKKNKKSFLRQTLSRTL